MPTVRIADIDIGSRHRQDMGDLGGLAESIRDYGLLQPIGVTRDGRLVFGERRLRAVRDVLGEDLIEARVIDIRSIVEGEYNENALRKDFTVSERVAIGKAVEAELGNRQGQRTDKELRDNCPEVEPGERTRDIAGQRAGFANGKTYERAKKTVDHGIPELVDRVDRGEVSISAASVVAEAPPERQKTVAALSEKEIIAEAKRIQAERSHRRRATIQTKQDAKAAEPVWPAEESRLRKELDAGRAIVVNMEGQPRITAYARQRGLLVPIDRSTEWGNPFLLPADGTRDEVCDAYEVHYLPFKKSLLSKLESLRGKALGCHCAPERCHGHGIINLLGNRKQDLRTRPDDHRPR